MRSFLGLVNYLNRFSPHLAELSEPLREICRQDVEFELTESVCVAFSRTKEEISKNVTLPYFNPKSATTLQTDASKKGLVINMVFMGGLWEVPVVPLQTFCLASERLICMVGILICRILHLSLRCDSWCATML